MSGFSYRCGRRAPPCLDRPDFQPQAVTRLVADRGDCGPSTYGRRVPVSVPRLTFLEKGVVVSSPVTGRILERRQRADDALLDAIRLARLIPQYQPVTSWIRSAQFEGRR